MNSGFSIQNSELEGMCPTCAEEVAEIIRENQALCEDNERLEMEYRGACETLDHLAWDVERARKGQVGRQLDEARQVVSDMIR